jgi:regulatory protein
VALIEQRAAEHEPPEADVQAAANAALQYLNRRDRTVSETWRRLAHGGFDAAAIEAAISRLLEDGFLDDARYARLYAEDRRNLDHWGTTRIRRALLERGVDRELVERTLSSHGVDAELDQAVALLRRRFLAAPSTRRERDRALGLLLRRGYDSELALQALAAYGTERLEDG